MNKGGFSWKRLIGISTLKSNVSRRLGIPLTKGGRQKKLGAIMIKVGVGLLLKGFKIKK